MLSHDLDALQTADPLHAVVPPLSSPLYRSSSDVEDALEDAVDRAIAPLIGTVPRRERLSRRAALRQELDTLVTAHCELTMIPEQAVADALAHFARLHPAPVLCAVPQTQAIVSQTSAKTKTASVRPALVLSLALLLPVYIAHLKDWNFALRSALWPGLSTLNMYRVELFLVPLLAGLLTGGLCRQRATRGMAYTCALLAGFAAGVPSLLTALSFVELIPSDGPLYQWLCPNPFAGYTGMVVWPLLGCGSAAAGAWLRRKAKGKSTAKHMK